MFGRKIGQNQGIQIMIARIVPVSRELILCYIPERVLGQPKSY